MNSVTIKSVCQSPILTHTLVESTQYALRLTPDNMYGVLEIEEFLKNFQEWIYSLEISKKTKEHYHIVLWSKDDEETVREYVRGFLKKYFINKSKRGDANKQYNLSEIEDLTMAVTYLLKDQGIIKYSNGVDSKTIDRLSKQSYKKFSKEEFAKSLDELKKTFKDTSPSLGHMMTEVVKLKSLYRQPVNLNYINQLCISFDIHNNPSKAEDYVRNFLSRYE